MYIIYLFTVVIFFNLVMQGALNNILPLALNIIQILFNSFYVDM